jgi:tol-pal system protein YbgF
MKKVPRQFPAAPQVQTPAKPAPPPEVQIPPDQKLYDVNMDIYRKEKYEEAIAGFKNFLDEYPKSKLADNAAFWIGESHMALKQYEQAILAFQKVIKKYPKGNKVPNALLRQALAFYELNDKTSAKLLLRKLIKQYPKTNEAKIAKNKLKTMK